MNTYLEILFDTLFENERAHRCLVDGMWPCPEAPYGLDVFVFELICQLESALHNEYVLEEIYLECCERLGINLDEYVFEVDPVDLFLNFMRSTGFKVHKYEEYKGE